VINKFQQIYQKNFYYSKRTLALLQIKFAQNINLKNNTFIVHENRHILARNCTTMYVLSLNL